MELVKDKKIGGPKDFINTCIYFSDVIEEVIIMSGAENGYKVKLLNNLMVYRDKLLKIKKNKDYSQLRPKKMEKYIKGINTYVKEKQRREEEPF